MMKKVLAAAILSSFASISYAETYQFLGGLGYSETDVDGADGVTTLDGIYYFAGQDTVGPLDQFSYLDDTSNVRADVKSGDSDTYSIGGSYFGERFGVGLDYSDFDEGGDLTRLHGDFFFADNFKGILGYSMPDEGDDVVDVALKYDQSINETDYIGYTLQYIDTEDSTVDFSLKYLNAFDNGQFLVLEGGLGDYAGNSGYSLAGKWYFSKKTGLSLSYASAEDGDLDTSTTGVGFTHFFNENFALELDYSMVDEDVTDYDMYGLELVLQL